MLIITAYFQDLNMDAYDGGLITLTIEGREYTPDITSSIGSD